MYLVSKSMIPRVPDRKRYFMFLDTLGKTELRVCCKPNKISKSRANYSQKLTLVNILDESSSDINDVKVEVENSRN